MEVNLIYSTIELHLNNIVLFCCFYVAFFSSNQIAIEKRDDGKNEILVQAPQIDEYDLFHFNFFFVFDFHQNKNTEPAWLWIIDAIKLFDFTHQLLINVSVETKLEIDFFAR